MNGVEGGESKRECGLECHLAPTELSRCVPRIVPFQSESIRSTPCPGQGAEPGGAGNRGAGDRRMQANQPAGKDRVRRRHYRTAGPVPTRGGLPLVQPEPGGTMAGLDIASMGSDRLGAPALLFGIFLCLILARVANPGLHIHASGSRPAGTRPARADRRWKGH